MNSDGSADDRWLAAQCRATAGELADVLDLNAGLREVLISAHHTGTIDSLEEHLDVEAGLAALLSAVPGRNFRKPAVGYSAAAEARRKARHVLRGLPPLQQLSLRHHSAAVASIYCALLLQALAVARALYVQGDIERAGSLADDLSRSVVQAGHHHQERGLAFSSDLTQARTQAHRVARHRELDGIGGVVIPLARALANALVSAARRDIALSPRMAQALSLALDLDRDRSIILDPEREATRVRSISRGVAESLARASVPTVAGVHEGLGMALLSGALDDFAEADLSLADLSISDLAGVRWSRLGTRWPASLDIDDLLASSREVEAGLGFYIVMPSPTPTHEKGSRV